MMFPASVFSARAPTLSVGVAITVTVAICADYVDVLIFCCCAVVRMICYRPHAQLGMRLLLPDFRGRSGTVW